MKIEAGQWWETRGGNRCRIVHVADEPILYEYQINGILRNDGQYQWGSWLQCGLFTHCGNDVFDLVKHLPDCTGWDWEPLKPVDPGEGWRLLEVGEVMQEGDQLYGWATNTWIDLGLKHGVLLQNELARVRRRVQPDVPADWQLIGGVPGGMLYFKPTEAM